MRVDIHKTVEVRDTVELTITDLTSAFADIVAQLVDDSSVPTQSRETRSRAYYEFAEAVTEWMSSIDQCEIDKIDHKFRFQMAAILRYQAQRWMPDSAAFVRDGVPF